MAAKINVSVPFKISHKASPCRGGHFSGALFFKNVCLFFPFLKKKGEPKDGTIRRAVSETKSRASSACSLFFFCQNERLVSYLWWRRSQCSQRWPTEEQPFKCWTQNLRGTKDFEIKGYWNLRGRFKGPTMPRNVSKLLLGYLGAVVLTVFEKVITDVSWKHSSVYLHLRKEVKVVIKAQL